MKQYNFIWLIMVVLLSACSVAPKTPDQSVYATYGTYTAISNTTADLLNQGSISKVRAVKIQGELQKIRPSLNIAVGLVSKGQPVPGDIMQTLQLAQTVLIEIQKELQRLSQ